MTFCRDRGKKREGKNKKSVCIYTFIEFALHPREHASTHLDGHDARDDGAGDAHPATALDVGQKSLRVVEELSDDEVRPGVDLTMQI